MFDGFWSRGLSDILFGLLQKARRWNWCQITCSYFSEFQNRNKQNMDCLIVSLNFCSFLKTSVLVEFPSFSGVFCSIMEQWCRAQLQSAQGSWVAFVSGLFLFSTASRWSWSSQGFPVLARPWIGGASSLLTRLGFTHTSCLHNHKIPHPHSALGFWSCRGRYSSLQPTHTSYYIMGQ